MKLPPDIFDAIRHHAEESYPEECCGVVLSHSSRPNELTRVRRCHNAQDKFHKLDPVEFPRTHRNAYFIDPKDLLAIERECRECGERVRLIYHSHPDAAAYFSEEDQRRAVVDGIPLHPQVDYLVVSVKSGTVGETKSFNWDAAAGKFVKQNPKIR